MDASPCLRELGESEACTTVHLAPQSTAHVAGHPSPTLLYSKTAAATTPAAKAIRGACVTCAPAAGCVVEDETVPVGVGGTLAPPAADEDWVLVGAGDDDVVLAALHPLPM